MRRARRSQVVRILVVLSLVAVVAAAAALHYATQTRHRHDTISTLLLGGTRTAKAWSNLSNTAVARAERYWHGTRCISAPGLSYAHLKGRRVAEAKWDYVPGTVVYLNCRIVFSTRVITFRAYCAAMVHEYGHLYGFYEQNGPNAGTHSSNPRSIMYPSLTERNVPRVCLKR